MKVIYVGKNQAVKTITEALGMTSYEEELTIVLEAGIYKEKIFCHKRMLRLMGQGMDCTHIVWEDGAYKVHPDGKKYGTFRSHTAFFDGEYLKVADITIENAAGKGDAVGQAVAAAVYTQYVHMENVRLLGNQDTLFLGPLPEKEREIDGFLGPRQHAPRVESYQLYENCEIQGDVDFIFGGGNGIFSHCKLYGRGERTGFLTAPSTSKGALGFFFEQCQIDAKERGNLYLGRPWRSYGRAVFYNCQLGEGIHPDCFDPWQEPVPTYFFAVYPEQCGCYTSEIDKEEMASLLQRVNELKEVIRLK